MKIQASKYKEVLSDIFGLGSMSLKNCRNRNNLLSKRTRKNNFIGNTPILKWMSYSNKTKSEILLIFILLWKLNMGSMIKPSSPFQFAISMSPSARIKTGF